MEKIEFAAIVRTYLRVVPHAADILREVPEPHRSSFEAWPEEESDLYEFLSVAFMWPILLPRLREEPVDREALAACFEFIEGLAKNPNPYMQNALYFEVYEQFLESRDILLKAQQFCTSWAVSEVGRRSEKRCEQKPSLQADSRSARAQPGNMTP